MSIRTSLYSTGPEWFQQFWSPPGSTSILIEIELAPKTYHVRLCSRIFLFLFFFNEHASNSELYSWPFHNIQKWEKAKWISCCSSPSWASFQQFELLLCGNKALKAKTSVLWCLFLPPPLSAKLMSCVI